MAGLSFLKPLRTRTNVLSTGEQFRSNTKWQRETVSAYDQFDTDGKYQHMKLGKYLMISDKGMSDIIYHFKMTISPTNQLASVTKAALRYDVK